MENKFDAANSEHYITGEGVIEYKEIKVTPEALKCKVKGGAIATNNLVASSKGLAKGAGKKMHLLFKPAAGTVIAEFELEECTEPALAGAYKLEGTVTTNEIDGATLTTSGATV